MLTTYIPLTAQTGSEPALTIANMVVAFMQDAPFCWPTNRAEDSSLTTVAGTPDYTLSITNFGFLETVTLTNSGKSFAVPNVYNSKALGFSNEQTSRPNAVSVKAIVPGTSVSLRFLSAPDLVYTGKTTYQMAPVLFSATSQDWFTQCNITGNQIQIYNNLFLAECFQVNGDEQSAALYRRRGMASLLATAEGLTEMQARMIFEQASFMDIQSIAASLRTQLAQQDRTV